MHDAKLEAQDLDQVILVGGQTRMPLIKQKVAEFFACSDFEENRGDIRIGQSFHEQEGPALHTGEHPDEAIALGAAIQGGILSGALNHLTLLDVTPLSLGLETFGGLMNVLIPRNSTIPTKAGEVFTTAVANQREMLIHVLQGERERAADNWSLGRFVVPFESAPRGVARVGVQFAIDANGILKVLARNLKDGTEQTLEIQSAIDVEDQQVSQMVESSVENALDDMESRRWIEQKLKAQQLLQAVDSSLEACGTSVDGNMVEVIELKVREVKQTLARENPETQKGDIARLKASMKELDEATQALAAMLLDEVASKLLE
jgi:molecular chaperone DnaK